MEPFESVDALATAAAKPAEDREIEWSTACRLAREVHVRLDWGDGYAVRVKVEPGSAHDLVADRTSRRFALLDRETAVFTAWLLRLRAGLPREAIVFEGPRTAAVSPERLLEWAAQCPGTEAAAEMRRLAESVRLPWERDNDAPSDP